MNAEVDKMTETRSRLVAALLRNGSVKLANELGLSEGEVSKKINGESGWKLDQLAQAFEFVGARVIPGTEDAVIISRDEYTALRTLARKSLESIGE